MVGCKKRKGTKSHHAIILAQHKNTSITSIALVHFSSHCHNTLLQDVYILFVCIQYFNLKYLYRGPKSHKRGRPQKFTGKVDINNLDMSVFKEALAFAFNMSLADSSNHTATGDSRNCSEPRRTNICS